MQINFIRTFLLPFLDQVFLFDYHTLIENDFLNACCNILGIRDRNFQIDKLQILLGICNRKQRNHKMMYSYVKYSEIFQSSLNNYEKDQNYFQRMANNENF